MNDLNRKNTAAVEQQLRELNDIVRKQQERIDGLVSTMSSMQERMGQLESTNGQLRARLMGNGPTA